MENEYVTKKIEEHDNKLNIHDNKINEIEKNQVESSTLMKNVLATQEKLNDSIAKFSETMTEVKTTMVSIQDSLNENKKEVQDLKNDVSSVNTRMDGLNNAFIQDVEKNKIDIRDVSKEEGKKNIAKMFTYGGAITGVVAVLGILLKVLQTLQQLNTVIQK